MSGEIGPDTVYQVSFGFSKTYKRVAADEKLCEIVNLAGYL